MALETHMMVSDEICGGLCEQESAIFVDLSLLAPGSKNCLRASPDLQAAEARQRRRKGKVYINDLDGQIGRKEKSRSSVTTEENTVEKNGTADVSTRKRTL